MNDQLTTKQTAYVLGITTKSLANQRYNGDGPDFYRVSHRHVIYLADDVERYINDKHFRIQRSMKL